MTPAPLSLTERLAHSLSQPDPGIPGNLRVDTFLAQAQSAGMCDAAHAERVRRQVCYSAPLRRALQAIRMMNARREKGGAL